MSGHLERDGGDGERMLLVGLQRISLHYLLPLVVASSALAQNAGVEFTLFPKNTGNGQMYVASIDGVSADGNSAAVSVGNAATFVGWWRRESGLTVLPASVFLIDGIQRSASVLNISADGLTLVGTHSPPVIGSGDNINYVYLYSEAEGRRSIPQPFTPMPFVSGPVQHRLFAPTTDRIVSSRLWLGRNGGPPFADVVVWTSASNTWQPLSNQFPPGSYVEATQMSDTGVTIGYLYAGSYFGPKYTWKHDSANGLTLIGDGSSFPARQLFAISRDGLTTAGIDLNAPTSGWWVETGGSQTIPEWPAGVTGGEISSVANGGAIVTGGGLVPGQIGNDVVYQRGVGYQTSYTFLQGLGIQLSANVTDVNARSVSALGNVFTGSIKTSSSALRQHYLVRWPAPAECDPIDFNNDGLFPTDEDVVDFLTVLAGGTCSNDPNCFDIDFNNDELFPSDEDLIAFLRVFAGGGC